VLVDLVAPVTASPLAVEQAAADAERSGYDGFGAPEARHDVFLALALAARATDRVTLQTAVAVAFARNPMTVAVAANDLQLISGGRFQLGLGSQVRAHIERRFAMPWSRPAARMEEFVAAVRAIWHTWATGDRLA
jgi:alkanesulfonate monooxygenase SsuD/methylene tetrahydromethanopterin reductase-like flavin-dependent oxidoreductase (luciferase family)